MRGRLARRCGRLVLACVCLVVIVDGVELLIECVEKRCFLRQRARLGRELIDIGQVAEQWLASNGRLKR